MWRSSSPDWCICWLSLETRRLILWYSSVQPAQWSITLDGSWKMVACWKQASRSMRTYNTITAPRFVFHTLTASGEEEIPFTVTVLIKFYLSPGATSVRMLGSGEIPLGVKQFIVSFFTILFIWLLLLFISTVVKYIYLYVCLFYFFKKRKTNNACMHV